jgi:hypothetical protein
MENEEINAHLFEFPTFGYLLTKVPRDILKVIRDEVDEIRSKNFKNAIDNRNNLIGHINNEYVLSDNTKQALEPFLMHLAEVYHEKWNFMDTIDTVSQSNRFMLTLEDLWVNFQKKYEFNPPHGHSGVYSFVIWLDIPYDLDEEAKVFSEVTNGNRTSKFSFHYTNSLGQSCHYPIPVDKEFENTLCLFPADMQHSVNPFYTSDEYRVSVAGNLRLKLGPL